jgi:hypothetical protein
VNSGRSIALFGLVSALAVSAQATVLTFAGLNLSQYGDIPQSYGDNVTGQGSVGTGTYSMGNAWTPNVTTSFQTVDNTGTQTWPSTSYWDTSYGDLVDVTFAAFSADNARIRFDAASGSLVRINSFDMGGWSQTTQTTPRLRILDGSGAILWNNDGATILGTGGTHSTFSPNITGGTLVIEFGGNWNVGIDNINFDQTPVPEPGSVLVLLAGAAVFRARRRIR